MEPFTFILHIEAVDEDTIDCHVHHAEEENSLCFSITKGSVSFLRENRLSINIRHNLHQLQKILRSARDGKLHIGQTIHCVFIDNFRFLQEEDFNHFIRLDRVDGKLDITTSANGLANVHRIYTDGSCNHQTGNAGYGGFIENPDGNLLLYAKSFSSGSSNLTELLAVIEGLRRLSSKPVIQINTDSRFVIRGLVQWVHFWRHNNWQTAYGRSVKHAAYWQQAYELCCGKLLEFKWIKGHSGHARQDFCHLLAKSAAENPCTKGFSAYPSILESSKDDMSLLRR